MTSLVKRLAPPADSADDATSDGAGSPDEATNGSHRTGRKRRSGRDGTTTLALHRMMGVDLTAIPTIGVNTALVVATEIGPELSAFPSAQHFTSWLGLAPGTRISGGKPVPGRRPKGVNRVAQALRMAAMSARSGQTFIGARHRARLARMDTPVAITATAREFACLFYLMANRGQEYPEKDKETCERRRLSRKFSSLRRQARKLGYHLVEIADGQGNAKAWYPWRRERLRKRFGEAPPKNGSVWPGRTGNIRRSLSTGWRTPLVSGTH